MNTAFVPRLKQLGLNGLAGQETQGQRSPTETATGRLGAIPAIRQVLADLRGALPGDSWKRKPIPRERANTSWNSPFLRKPLGVGGLLVGTVSMNRDGE